jgi:signal peptidase II
MRDLQEKFNKVMLLNRKNILFLSLAFGLIFLDQLSKYLIRHFGGFYICNSGIAFGVKIPEILFWIFWLVIMVVVSILLISKFKNRKTSDVPCPHCLLDIRCLSAGLIFILSGAISNIIDRLYFGCITDFIDLKFWPVFNLADSFIVIGAILILIRTTDSH